MNALKYHWCENSLLSQAVLKYAVSKHFILKKSVQGTGSVFDQECRNLWHHSISKDSLNMIVGHKWVIAIYVGHIWIVLWVSESNGSTVVPTFDPDASVVLRTCMHAYSYVDACCLQHRHYSTIYACRGSSHCWAEIFSAFKR